MKIVVDINHPKHFHFFKNFIERMRNRGHQIAVTASEKDVSYRLLDNLGLNYVPLGSYGRSFGAKLRNLLALDIKMYMAINRFNPDIFIGLDSIRAAHVSYFLHKSCINFDDTEHAREQIMLYLPFVSTVCTPSWFMRDLGKKHVRFNGFFELAYLHPNYFTPSPAVLDDLGLTKDDTLIVVRFVSWDASHDIGQRGIRDKKEFIRALEQYGHVLITSEGHVGDTLTKNHTVISPENMHDLLYYASLYVGEGGTMAAEAAILGTPAIYISSLAGKMGNFIELEHGYDLMYSFKDSTLAMDKVISLLRRPHLKDEWEKKRAQLLEDKIDVTAFMMWFVENYPRSYTEMKTKNMI